MHLTSPKNPFLQSIRRAITAGRTTEDGRIVIEGPHLVQEILRSPWRLDQIFTTPNGRERYAQLAFQNSRRGH